MERDEATELFGTVEAPSVLASKVGSLISVKLLSFLSLITRKIMGIKSRTFDVPSVASGLESGKAYRVKLTPEEKKRVEELIRNAKSLQEITRLEKELNEGRIPG